jgi:hypothetical protein
MAFGLNASSMLTQLLFFKFRSDGVELQHASGSVTISEQVLAAVRDPITKRLVGYAEDYVRNLPGLG